MRDGAAEGGDDGGHPCRVECGCLHRAEVGCDEDTLDVVERFGRGTAQLRLHLPAHGVDVGGAGSLIRVGERGEPVGDVLDGLPPRLPRR